MSRPNEPGGTESSSDRGWLRRRATAIDQFLRRPMALWIFAVLVIAIYTAAGAYLFHPYVDDVSNFDGDDWGSYKRNAVSIVEDGLALRAIPEPYSLPGSFLYNYWVAAVFSIFGINSAIVYVSHFSLQGCALLIFYILARDYLSPAVSLMFTAATAALLYFDFRELAPRLLSENLIIAILPLVFLLIHRAARTRSRRLHFVAGIATGIVVLTRLNLLFLPATAALLLLFASERAKRTVANVATYVVAAGLVFSLLPIRNYAASGRFTLDTYGGVRAESSEKRQSAELIVARLAFGVGVVKGGWTGTGPTEVNGHLLALNIGAVMTVVAKILYRRFELLDLLIVTTVVIANILYAALLPLGGYGFRFQLPFAPFLLLLTMKLFDMVRVRKPGAGTSG